MKSVLVLLSCLLLFACSDNDTTEDRKDGYTSTPKSKEDSLFHEVMQAHDTGMAKMGNLVKYQKQIQQVLDSLDQLTDREKAAALDYKNFLIRLQEELQQAEAGMNLWMEQFRADSVTENKEKRIEYLGSEKTKVEKVREDILNSLRRADSLFSARNPK